MGSTTKDIGMAEVRQEAASSEVARTQAGNAAINFALAYVEKQGATARALFRAAEIAAVGRESPRLAALYRTHPAPDVPMDRIDKRGYDALKAYTTRE